MDERATRREHVLAVGYDPADVEPRWADAWIDRAAWRAVPDDRPPYCIILPPPNVTGSLHMGHALNDTLQDVLIRYRRMDGDNVLWQPGTDHAGIATQTVVERKLRAEGKDRRDMGRDAFLTAVWDWKEQSGSTIVRQLKTLGASCDWSRERFTMDAHSSRAVREAFVRLYEEGLIYRGTYLVNWCPRCHTALSDLEVEMEEIDGGLYDIHYPLSDGSGQVTVATTRPETMLGDTAVAVHPEDPRYRDWVGRTIRLPLVGREIPIIADEHVHMDFGTGALKVTPAHDFNDEEIGKRHALPQVNIFDQEARVVGGYEPYSGLDRGEARKRIVQDLKAAGLLGGSKSIRHAVGHCYRCHTVVEPYLSPQWFVRTRPLADKAMALVDRGDVRFLPDQWDRVFRNWMADIRDWCISRQLWWGHRIPVWTCADCGHEAAHRDDPTSCPECGGEYRQDADVLDTWFSSGLWPLSTLGWPDDTADLRQWYPTSALVTGFDILFFWVARMLMFGAHFMGTVPFRDVVLHAIVRDEDGEKMSKTKGNVVDPLDLIREYGADAMRFTLTSQTALGRDIRLNRKRIEGYRHFANKLWNATRLVLRSIPADMRVPAALPAPRHPLNRWILGEIDAAATRVRAALDTYAFQDYAQETYQLAWDRYCDWYLEGAKILLREFPEHVAETQATLVVALERILRLLHPAMPFVTEELAATLPLDDVRLVALRPFPRAEGADTADAVAAFAVVAEAVRAIRNIRAENNLPPGQTLPVMVHAAPDSPLCASAWRPLIVALARAASWETTAPQAAPEFSATSIGASFQVWVPLAGLVDVASEIERLDKLLQTARAEADRADRKLANAGFVARAPADVVAEERRKRDEARAAIARGEPHLAMLRRYAAAQA